MEVVERVKRFPWRLITVEPALFLLVFANGIVSPTNRAVLYRKVCLNIYNSTAAPWDQSVTICDNLRAPNYTHYQNEVQAQTSVWEFYESLCSHIPMLLTIGMYGSWSDRFSRQIPLFFCPVGMILHSGNYLINALFMDASPGFILIGSLAMGISGGLYGYLMATFSYLAATVPTESGNRTTRISTTYAMNAAGIAISYALSGVILDNAGFVAVYSIVLTLYVLLVTYIAVRLRDVKRENPEDLKKTDSDNKNNLDEKAPNSDDPASAADDLNDTEQNDKLANRANSNETINPKPNTQTPNPQPNGDDKPNDTAPKVEFSGPHNTTPSHINQVPKSGVRECGSKCILIFGIQHTITALTVTFRKRQGYTRLAIFLVVSSLFFIIVTNAGGVSYLFYLHAPLNWSQSMYGYYVGFQYTISFTASLLALPLLKKRFGVSDEALLVVGVLGDMAMRFWTGFCRTTWMVFLTPLVGYTGSFVISCIRGLVSAMVDNDEYGKIFAVVAWLECIGSILASLLYNDVLYPLTVAIYAGFSFIISGLLTAIPLALAVCLLLLLRRNPIIHHQGAYEQFVDDGEGRGDAASHANDIIAEMQHISIEEG